MKDQLLAFAVGDALGYPFEGKKFSEEHVKNKYFGAGELRFSDDTFLFINSMETICLLREGALLG